LNFGYPVFPGKNEVNQFEKICELIGKPNEKVWPDFVNLPGSQKLSSMVSNMYFTYRNVIHNKRYNNIPKKFNKFSANCINLVNGLLTWDPKKRMTVFFLLVFHIKFID